MATDKSRISIYVDKEILQDIREVAEGLDMSISKLTRLMYLAAIGMNNFGKKTRNMVKEIEQTYPDGVPLEAAKERFMDVQNIMNEEILYVTTLLAGARAKGFSKRPENLDFRTLMKEATKDLEEMKAFTDALDDSESAEDE